METDRNLTQFIKDEKELFSNGNHGINWESTDWDCSNWLFHRGDNKSISFRELGRVGRRNMAPLPLVFQNFCKAIVVYLQRTKDIGFISIHKYLIECKRIYSVMHERGEENPLSLTRWHFERALELLVEANYKNLYDASASLKVVADAIDKKRLLNHLLDFSPSLKPLTSRHDYVPIGKIDSDDERKDDEKLPSYEAMAAYAKCTNEPINEYEEILLRTIDLLIAMGQRANEVTLIPYDCWVEREQKSRDGSTVYDAHNEPVKKIGIRYYAEKNAKDKVHWLADQDVPFAKRAIDRLKTLTSEYRRVAEWQEKNQGRLWEVDAAKIIVDDFILSKISFACHYNLHLFLARNGVRPVKVEWDHNRINKTGPERYRQRHYYQAGKIENLIIEKFFENHDQLKIRNGKDWQTILSTSQVLSIKPHGAFQLKQRGDFIVDLVIERVTIREINVAIGASDDMQSIFERRNLTEANGEKITLTSHMARHWRNTLYELAGMSNVQQALALGRQRLDQNPTYQHTSLLERTQPHRDFLSFSSLKEKIQFLHHGVREQKILGEITTLYHKLKSTRGLDAAETVLSTHGTAIHLTPFGGCTHDFSQAPCPKHLQCWNGCGHLHRTNAPGESERIEEQIELSKIALKSMKEDAEGEYGADVWVKDLENKIDNMQKALDIKPVDSPVKVFPGGKQFTIAFEERKGSSV